MLCSLKFAKIKFSVILTKQVKTSVWPAFLSILQNYSV